MTLPVPPLLVVDDEKNMRLSLQTMLGDEGYSVLAVESAEAGLELLGKETVFMVITDARLGGMSGYDFLHKIRSRWPDLPILMITAYATPKLAVEVIKAGAMDYLAKPFAPEELLHVVGRCAERHRLLQTNAQLLARASETYQLDQIVGDSAKMRELRQLIQTVAPTDARSLILGESGTGKELVAGALHSLSHRRRAPYIRINCAAIPENLLESELFGHEKGAFTGAQGTRRGVFEQAHGGTLFIDELGLAHARSRIDIAVINGCIHGYEIKSDKDNLTRFGTQIDTYRQTLQKLTFVAAPKHVAGIMSRAPQWCGVIAAEQGPRGGIKFMVERNAATNPEVDPVMMAHLLWRDEVIELLDQAGYAAKDLRRPKKQLYQMLCEAMTVSEITASILAFMTQRSKWRDRPARASCDG